MVCVTAMVCTRNRCSAARVSPTARHSYPPRQRGWDWLGLEKYQYPSDLIESLSRQQISRGMPPATGVPIVLRPGGRGGADGIGCCLRWLQKSGWQARRVAVPGSWRYSRYATNVTRARQRGHADHASALQTSSARHCQQPGVAARYARSGPGMPKDKTNESDQATRNEHYRPDGLRISVLLPNSDSIRSTATSAVRFLMSSAGFSSITSSEPRRPVSAIISMHNCASR